VYAFTVKKEEKPERHCVFSQYGAALAILALPPRGKALFK
jgi:hypothetical protein